MAAPSGPPASKSGGMIPSEWPVQAADVIVDTIGKVRDKTTRPALIAVRALVYGVILAVVAGIALVTAIITGVRLYANYAPGPVYWLYAGLSVVFIASGLILLRKANAPAPARD